MNPNICIGVDMAAHGSRDESGVVVSEKRQDGSIAIIRAGKPNQKWRQCIGKSKKWNRRRGSKRLLRQFKVWKRWAYGGLKYDKRELLEDLPEPEHKVRWILDALSKPKGETQCQRNDFTK